MKNFYLIWLVCVLLLCCKSKPESNQANVQPVASQQNINVDSYSAREETLVDGYEDGEYCATINYYNSSTGNSSTYTLEVEVENGELVKVNWPNGGWLDSSHFNPPEIESDGSCSFSTFDGKDYEVQIEGNGGCGLSYSSPQDDEITPEDVEEVTENDEYEGGNIEEMGLQLGINHFLPKILKKYSVEPQFSIEIILND